jgi:flagellar biosynthesis GTPase FlhF
VPTNRRKEATAGKPVAVQDLAQDHLTAVAEHTLEFFRETAANAFQQLGEKRPQGEAVFAVVNTLTADRAMRNLEGISQARAQELRVLSTEPAIARIVVKEKSGDKKTYFISRGTPSRPPSDGSAVASYRSPVGRLAALPVGSDVDLVTPKGVRRLGVLERAALRPKVIEDEWDSVDSTVQGTKFGPLTVKSFRELLRSAAAEHEGADLLDAMLAEDRAAGNVVEGLRRSVIAKMELRDQPLLDQYQDEIFRLPLDARLVILGPPGTGKTTTLIKRLGLKLDAEYLSEEEREQVRATMAGSPGHAQSWIMFTPTDLLRQYVKEAFARENIPASDLRIQTWADYRRELARHRFGVLRTAAGTGNFVMKDGLPSLQPATLARQTQWFGDFDKWQVETFWADLQAHAKNLATNPDPSIARVGTRLNGIIDGVSGASASAFISISEGADEVQSLISRLKGDTDSKIRTAVARELAHDKTLLDQLVDFLDALGDGIDEADDQEGEDEEEVRQPRIGREAAFDAYARAIRAQARSAASGRSVNRESRSGKITEWLGDRRLPPGDLRNIGVSLQVQSSARRFANPLRRYFDGLPVRYRRFRREQQSEGRWYRKDGFGPSDLGPLEVDVILLALLRGMRSLLGDRRIARDFAQGRYATLKPAQELYRTQVAVDEATDFSPIQLACMAAICDPSTQSFVACGDFNQRVTEWGSRSTAELKWVFPDFDIRSVNITYRHSRQLNHLARSIALLSSSDAPEAQLPQRVDNEGVDPVLRQICPTAAP